MKQIAYLIIIAASVLHLSCKQKETNLHYAIAEGNIHKVKRLINNGADINANIKTHHHSPMPALHKAIIYYNAAIIDFLLKKGADIHAKNSYGDTPLHLAVSKNKVKLVKQLIQENIDVNARNNNGETALHHTPNSIIAKILIDKGAKINVKDNKGDQPIHWAVSLGDLQFVALLLKKGADVNARMQAQTKNNHYKMLNGSTPLHFVFMSGKNAIPIARLLIKNGAHINAQNDVKKTPLHFATSLDKVTIVDFLVRHGAKINIQDKWGNTPLHGISSKKAKVPALLLSKGARLLKNNQNQTPLHFAASRYNVKCVRLFIKYGADINTQDTKGNTPLHYIAKSEPIYSENKDKPYKIARLLLSHGANVSIKNNKGKTPLQIAKEKKNDKMIKILNAINNKN